MKHLTTKILVAILTLITGIAGTGLFIDYYHSDYRLIDTDNNSYQQFDLKIEINKESKPEGSSQIITFTDAGNLTNFKPWYKSSDGKILRKFCQKYKSVAKATEMLYQEIIGKNVIERNFKLDKNGKTIGERIVVNDTTESNEKTKIAWTNGTRYLRLEAPSLKHALLFEESFIWDDGYCL